MTLNAYFEPYESIRLYGVEGEFEALLYLSRRV